jgi:hypothetical protein
MAQGKGSGGGKERIIPPSRPVVSEAGRNLPSGERSAGRILSERNVAREQNVKRPPTKKP